MPVHVPVEAVVAAVVDPDVLKLDVVHVDGLQDDLQLGHHRGQLSQPSGRNEGDMSGVSLLESLRKTNFLKIKNQCGPLSLVEAQPSS